MKRLRGIAIMLIVLWPALAMSLKSDIAAFRTVEYFTPDWVIGAISLRIIAAALFALGVFFLFNITPKFVKYLTIFLLLPVSDNVAIWLGYDQFGSLFTFSNSVIEGIVQSFFLVAVAIWAFWNSTQKAKHPVVYPLIIVIGIGLSFTKPLYIDDWVKPEENGPVGARKLNNFFIERDINIDTSQPYLAAFFTTNCPYCALAAAKIGISGRNGHLPQVIVIFPSERQAALEFMSKNGISDVPFLLVDDDTFLEYAGKSWPSVYYLNERTVYHFNGGSFNYRALEFINPQK